MQISRRCPFIQHQVETRVKCFFPKLEYQEIAASLIGASFGRYEPNSIFRYRSVKCLKESPCYIVYCPSIWTENIESLLLDIQKVLSAEGFVLLVEAGTMQDYFNTVDALQKKNRHELCDGSGTVSRDPSYVFRKITGFFAILVKDKNCFC